MTSMYTLLVHGDEDSVNAGEAWVNNSFTDYEEASSHLIKEAVKINESVDTSVTPEWIRRHIRNNVISINDLWYKIVPKNFMVPKQDM